MILEGRVLPGLDVANLEKWLSKAVPATDHTGLSAQLIEGGKSNLTYVVTGGARRWVLRRPPLGHVLATAHDMGREYRVMSALQDTVVPVPRTMAACHDVDVIGAPFYLMEYIEGHTYRLASDLEPLGRERTRHISSRMIDTLVAIHLVDHRAVGLENFGRPEGFLSRQVHRWALQLEASHCRDLPDADRLHALLADRVPGDANLGIVHGDFRLDNVLVDDSGEPASVIDWEMSTIGDTLTDLALTVIYQRIGDIAGGGAIASASSAPGFLSEQQLIDRYARGSGHDLAGLGFYLGLAAYKLAGILEGIHFRYQRGETVGAGFDEVGAVVEPLLSSGINSIREYH